MRLSLSVVMACVGAVLLGASALGHQRTGVLRIATSYVWEGSAADYALCLNLLNFPDTGGSRTA